MNEYRTYTHADPHRLKRWTHRRRFEDALQLVKSLDAQSVLDYGCGDGYLVHALHQRYPNILVSGYDPLPTMAQQARALLSGTKVMITEQLAELPLPSYDMVLCLETCEHLVSAALQQTLDEIRGLLAPQGTAVFSVPVERGLISLVKNIFRLRKRHGYENLSWKTIVAAAAGQHVDRPVNMNLGFPYYFSHVGFDERQFEQELRQWFVIQQVRRSPWNWLPRWCNPTIYYICRALS